MYKLLAIAVFYAHVALGNSQPKSVEYNCNGGLKVQLDGKQYDSDFNVELPASSDLSLDIDNGSLIIAPNLSSGVEMNFKLGSKFGIYFLGATSCGVLSVCDSGNVKSFINGELFSENGMRVTQTAANLRVETFSVSPKGWQAARTASFDQPLKDPFSGVTSFSMIQIGVLTSVDAREECTVTLKY